MPPYAEDDGVIGELIPVGLSHCLLELNGGTQRIDRAGELDQRAVAGQLYQSPAVTRQYRVQALFDGPSAGKRAVLIPAHQPRVAGDVGRDDGGKPALLKGQWNFVASHLGS